MDQSEVDRYLKQVQRNLGGSFSIEIEILEQILDKIFLNQDRIVLFGFTEYAKHAINVFDETGQILAIADNDPKKHGWTYKSISVVSLNQAFELGPKHFFCCSISARFEIAGQLLNHPKYSGQSLHFFPDPNQNIGARIYKDLEHSNYYRKLQEDRKKAPPSMCDPQRQVLLIELLKLTMHLPDDVMEVGVWMGGSAWTLAHFLAHKGSAKSLILVDTFEKPPPVGIMMDVMFNSNLAKTVCLDEVKSYFSLYPNTRFFDCDANEEFGYLEGRTFCFIHLDAVFQEGILSHCFEKLAPGGILLLDNYKELVDGPRRFDAWFAKRGHEVVSIPWSGQGFVIKRF